MAYKIVFRPFAENDLVALYEYIAENSSHDRAGAYIARIEHACISLAEFPFRGAKRDDLYPGLRIIGFERRASIAFVVESETVRILRIFYGGRDFPEDWDDS
ncbi:type II toxin-antitoxin system RelE/ParE family toxin [Pararhizobium sp. PWRC1-1]|uniref:type II toxin-antitoxin system RelE/ParE family toxin n=1 Tax=Pararhizobium sp. PWRC1-1 TaxID=2804566 RepID=UPI003CE6DCC6